MTGAVAPEPTAPFGQWVGGQITDHAHCLVQGNPGPMTLDGTNTWVLLAPGGTEAIVIDPGEDEPEHQQRVVEHVSGLGARVARIVVTHGHRDHDEGVPRLVALTGAPVSAVGRGHDDLADGAVGDERAPHDRVEVLAVTDAEQQIAHRTADDAHRTAISNERGAHRAQAGCIAPGGGGQGGDHGSTPRSRMPSVTMMCAVTPQMRCSSHIIS